MKKTVLESDRDASDIHSPDERREFKAGKRIRDSRACCVLEFQGVGTHRRTTPDNGVLQEQRSVPASCRLNVVDNAAFHGLLSWSLSMA